MAEEQGGRQEAGWGEGKASPAAIARYLKGIDFPATKDELIEHARENDAPTDVLKILDMIDEKEYRSVVDITKEVGRVE